APASGRDVDHTGHRVAAVEDAVRSAEHLDALDAAGHEVGEVEAAADVVRGDAVEQDLVEIRAATTDEERGRAAAPSGLHDVASWHRSKRLEQIGAPETVDRCRIEHRHGRADLRLR